jgi:predicted MFS family arabinose efflux permease
VLLFAFCCGAIVSNLYYAQPLIEMIAPDIGLSAQAASLIVSLTQIGYGVGLLFLVPLGDLFENRRLMIATLIVAMMSLAGASFSQSAASLLAFSVLIGFSSVSVQMIVPIAASMADDATRGRVVGTVMSGLLFGVLLSRPVASLIADHFGWRVVFGCAGGLTAFMVVMLAAIMPRRQPTTTARYGALLRSMGTLLRNHALLRQRSFYQACMFGSLTLFWTAVPVELARHFGYSQSHIALFALVGAAGAFAAPLTGRLADAGHGRVVTAVALAGAALSFLPMLMFPSLGVIGLGITAVVFDMCIQMSMVVGQREIYALDATSRNRLNSVYITSLFIGGAAGSALASVLYDHGGWSTVAEVGSAVVTVALVKFVYDHRSRPPA